MSGYILNIFELMGSMITADKSSHLTSPDEVSDQLRLTSMNDDFKMLKNDWINIGEDFKQSVCSIESLK